MALKSKLLRLAAVVVLLWCDRLAAQSGKLRRDWQVDLTKEVNATDAVSGLPIFALRFSPDGRKLAAIAGVFQNGETRKSRLLVIDVDHPSNRVRQFEVNFGILENENGRGSSMNFGWAPSGEIVYALGTVIHLADDTTCNLPNQSIFVTDKIALSVRPEPVEPLTRISFYDDNCQEGEKWEVAEAWLVSDVSLDRGLLSVLRVIASSVSSERLLVDPIKRTILQRWSETGGGAWEFADSGRVVCKGGAILSSDRAPAVCRDVDTGKETGQTVKNGVEPIATSARATRAVVSDYQRKRIPFDYEYVSKFKGRYVWDFETGRELASWVPDSESYTNVFKPAQQIKEPYRFAMSPDGNFVAEGGNGIVRLYKLEP